MDKLKRRQRVWFKPEDFSVIWQPGRVVSVDPLIVRGVGFSKTMAFRVRSGNVVPR